MNTPEKTLTSFYAFLSLLFFQSASGLYGGYKKLVNKKGNAHG